MPVGTFEYRDEAEKAAVEQHIALVPQMRDRAITARTSRCSTRWVAHLAEPANSPRG